MNHKLNQSQNKRHTKEENQWLINNIENYESYDAMVKDYNRLFNRNYKNGRNLAKYCKTYLKLEKINRHLWGVTCDTKQEKYNVLEEVTRKNGIYIKLSCGKFIEKGRFIYEQTYGKIPSEDFVIHLDGNNFNNDIDNLYHITRKVGATMSKLGYWGKGKLTLAGIKYCELIQKLERNYK
jgi:hypothetical protein